MISSVNPSGAGNSEVVINENSVDTDFRVETDEGITPQWAFFVRGSDGKIGVHDSNPTYNLDISGSVRFQNEVRDEDGGVGTAGQVLSSTVTGSKYAD